MDFKRIGLVILFINFVCLGTKILHCAASGDFFEEACAKDRQATEVQIPDSCEGRLDEAKTICRKCGYIGCLLGARELWCDVCRDSSLKANALLQIGAYVDYLLNYKDGKLFPEVNDMNDDVLTQLFIAYKILNEVRSVVPGFCQKQSDLLESFIDELNILEWNLKLERSEQESRHMDIEFFHRVRDLINNPAKALAVKCHRHGRNYLHTAAKDRERFESQLYLAAGADPDAVDYCGFTPLHLTIKGYYDELDGENFDTVSKCLGLLMAYQRIIKLLVLCGANLNSRIENEDFAGLTSLGLARAKGDFGMCEFLRSLGAKE